MIKVTVEIWPFGSEKNKKVLAEAWIANDGTGSKNVGNYDVWLQQKTARSLKYGRVQNYKRLYHPIWKLVQLCIESAFKGDASPDTDFAKYLKRRAGNATEDL